MSNLALASYLALALSLSGSVFAKNLATSNSFAADLKASCEGPDANIRMCEELIDEQMEVGTLPRIPKTDREVKVRCYRSSIQNPEEISHPFPGETYEARLEIKPTTVTIGSKSNTEGIYVLHQTALSGWCKGLDTCLFGQKIGDHKRYKAMVNHAEQSRWSSLSSSESDVGVRVVVKEVKDTHQLILWYVYSQFSPKIEFWDSCVEIK